MNRSNINAQAARTTSPRSVRGGRARTRALLAGLAIGIAFTGEAAAQAFTGITLPTGTSELRPIGISGTGPDIVIPFKAIREEGIQVYEMAGVWSGGIAHLAPNPIGDDGRFQDLVNIQHRAMRALGQTIPGIDIIVKKTPADKAMYWDTRGSDAGVLVDLDATFGSAAWPGGLNADGSLITGAVFGDLDGSGHDTRAAVQWVNGGMAELLPVPGDSQHSEVFGTSPGGTSVGCYKAIKESGVQYNVPRMIPSEDAAGMVWLADGGFRVISPSIAGADVASLVLTGIADGGSVARAAISTTRSNSKGGLIADLSGSNSWLEPNLDFTLLDAGDINGDGLIDLLDDHDSESLALSADGSMVGGSVTIFGEQRAALWIANGSGYDYHDASSYLASLGATGMTGWTLLQVTGVSPDGGMIAGVGINPLGQTTGWYASIPSPGALSLLALAGTLPARRRR